ncbi:MAG: hypothetical protein WCT08_02540 [Patescibacteria group bacterium]|jgi:hypothetical protein
MLTIVFCVLGCAIWLINRYGGKPLSFEKVVLGFIMLFLSTCLGLILAFLVGSCFKQQMVQVQEIPLIALRGSALPSGNFFLGTGQLDAEMYYWFYRRLPEDDNCFQVEKLKADNEVIYLYEEDRPDGVLRKFQSDFVNHSHLFGFPAIKLRFEFHVPRGSIARNFAL